MRRLIACVVLALIVCATFIPAPARGSACASVSASEVAGNCLIKHWTVCCEGPGYGEVSCFNYDEIVFCTPIIN